METPTTSSKNKNSKTSSMSNPDFVLYCKNNMTSLNLQEKSRLKEIILEQKRKRKHDDIEGDISLNETVDEQQEETVLVIDEEEEEEEEDEEYKPPPPKKRQYSKNTNFNPLVTPSEITFTLNADAPITSEIFELFLKSKFIMIKNFEVLDPNQIKITFPYTSKNATIEEKLGKLGNWITISRFSALTFDEQSKLNIAMAKVAKLKVPRSKV